MTKRANLFGLLSFSPILASVVLGLMLRSVGAPWTLIYSIFIGVLMILYMRWFRPYNWRFVRVGLAQTQYARERGLTVDNFSLFKNASDLKT